MTKECMSQMMKLKTPLHWMRGVLLALLVLAGMPQQVLAQMTVTYFHNEISGSAVAASDSAGRVVWKENYRPYGERQVKAAGSESNGVWFAGKPQEARSGLVYMGARYYDPVAGRFMGVDPVGWQEDNLHSFNRYAYANNNPYRYVDPDGQMPAIAWAVFEVVAWLGARSAATVAVVETGAVIASGAVSPPVAIEGVVAKAAATGVTSLSPSLIRFSQSSVNGVDEITASMRAHGWNGAPIDVVRMSDGALTTFDNTRLLAAQRAGINVQAVVRDAAEAFPACRWTPRSGVQPATWGDAVGARIQQQSSGFRNTYPNGSQYTGSPQ